MQAHGARLLSNKSWASMTTLGAVTNLQPLAEISFARIAGHALSYVHGDLKPGRSRSAVSLEAVPHLHRRRQSMLKIRLSYLAAAAVLLSGVSAHGAQSTFPSSVSEVPPSFRTDAGAHGTRVDLNVGATVQATANAAEDSGRSGAPAHSFGRHGWEAGPASTFPASPNESGSFR